MIDSGNSEIRSMVEDFLARGTITMVAGEAGAGKSAMTQHIAVSMANAATVGLDDDDCAGLTVRAGKVLIVDACENGANLVRGRLQAAGLTLPGAQYLLRCAWLTISTLSTGVHPMQGAAGRRAAQYGGAGQLLSSLWSGSISRSSWSTDLDLVTSIERRDHGRREGFVPPHLDL